MNTPRSLVALHMLSVVSALAAQVPYDRILHSATNPGAWLTYSGSYQSHRYSRLNQITRKNVGLLRPVWVYQAGEQGSLEATPLVVDDVVYLTEANSVVTALDSHTGRPLWRWSPSPARPPRTIGFGPTNRGVAILDRTVFVGTLDARLVALDAASGAVRWSVAVANNANGYAITSAPLALDGKVLIGVSGGEAGIRGFLDAYDAKTGARLWRFWTIPAPGDPGNETWQDSSWTTGGGPTWLSGSYDPELNTVYWGVGNPGPDWNGERRAGDNLYTCSLVALDASTGKLKWYFQFTPHDTHDWDANQIPVLIDLVIDGRMRKTVATANRNGFYYLLDRVTGEFISATPYVHQTWASGLDSGADRFACPIRSLRSKAI
jgi:alcohol dehydrogenase (cytochrome c)